MRGNPFFDYDSYLRQGSPRQRQPNVTNNNTVIIQPVTIIHDVATTYTQTENTPRVNIQEMSTQTELVNRTRAPNTIVQIEPTPRIDMAIQTEKEENCCEKVMSYFSSKDSLSKSSSLSSWSSKKSM